LYTGSVLVGLGGAGIHSPYQVFNVFSPLVEHNYKITDIDA